MQGHRHGYALGISEYGKYARAKPIERYRLNPRYKPPKYHRSFWDHENLRIQLGFKKPKR